MVRRSEVALWSFIISIVLVCLTLIVDLGKASSVKWMFNIFAVFGIFCLFWGIHDIRTERGWWVSIYYSERVIPSIGVFFILFLPIFAIILFHGSIYPPDIPGGFLLILSGIFALIGVIAFERRK